MTRHASTSDTSASHINAFTHTYGRQNFEGLVRVLSISSTGEIDGLVIEDGSFVEIAPYAFVEGLTVKIGDLISGEGELVEQRPHRIFRLATLFKGDVMIANENTPLGEREAMSEAHRHAENDLIRLSGYDLAHQELENLSGTLMAVNLRAVGSIERLVFENQASVHLPERFQLSLGDVEIGEFMTVRGRVAKFENGIYVLADRVVNEDGDIRAMSAATAGLAAD